MHIQIMAGLRDVTPRSLTSRTASTLNSRLNIHLAIITSGLMKHQFSASTKPAAAHWTSDRYSAQQNHAVARQTCLAHLALDTAYAMEASDDNAALWLKLWFDAVFAFEKRIRSSRSPPRNPNGARERQIADNMLTLTDCPIAQELLAEIARARDQLLTFCDYPGEVEPTNNDCERALRPAVIQRKVTNGFRAKWAADHDAAVLTTLDTARLNGAEPFGTILQTITP